MKIRDQWGKEIFKSDSYEEIVVFAKKYKLDNSLTLVEVLNESGSHHSFI